MTTTAAHAAIRFGLGAGPTDLSAMAGDPRGWVTSQLEARPDRPAALAARDGSLARAELFRVRRLLQMDPENPQNAEILRRRQLYVEDMGARVAAAVESRSPLVERLVHFWSNHFTVSVTKPLLTPFVLPFETEAIRPHVLGRFGDMLQAAVTHPAMLFYLDNAVSAGPNSLAGRLRGRGLNENLGREVLELHTLGVNGGYTQDDVRSLALILTGWTLNRRADGTEPPSQFLAALHEPGPKTLLGKRYPEAGADELKAALADLADHPATAQHVATKLVRHFISDDPPARAVDTLAETFRKTGGDLRAVSLTLVGLDAAWSSPLGKVKSPNDLVISALRALNTPAPAEGVVRSLYVLGQAPFTAPSPAGWPDTADGWLGPEAAVRRVDWAVALGRRVGSLVDARAVTEAALGDLATPSLRQAVARAPSPAEGIALLLSSPAFQRR